MAKARPAVDTEALLTRIEDAVRTEGVVARTDWSAVKRHLPELTPRLLERGYEIGSTIRRPLDAQILALADRGFLLMKGLEKQVRGATLKEVKAAVERLVERRALSYILRESGLGVARQGSEPVDPGELNELLRRLSKVQTLVRKAVAKKGGTTVLREDVNAPFSRWLSPDLESHTAHACRNDAPSEKLALEIRKRVVASRLPMRVPELLRALGATQGEGTSALLDGVARGFFDLEPESGMGRLSPEDAALCPTGPMGTRLSWVVVREQKGAD